METDASYREAKKFLKYRPRRTQREIEQVALSERGQGKGFRLGVYGSYAI